MSYSLARKVFECTKCDPPRTIKMLVGGDIMSVICDECRTAAPIKKPKEEIKEEEKIQPQQNGN